MSVSSSKAKPLTAWTPSELELEARHEYLDGRMSPNGYRIVSEMQRRLMFEGCHCIGVTEGDRHRRIRVPDCPFHAGMPNVG